MTASGHKRATDGENDKSSRKNIPLRKRPVNKANRNAVQQPCGADGWVDVDRAVELAEVRPLAHGQRSGFLVQKYLVSYWLIPATVRPFGGLTDDGFSP